MNKIGTLVKTSLVDYPANPCIALFLRGCNLRCPYCYNYELFAPEKDSFDKDFISLEYLIKYLKKREGILKAFVISGGEPLINPMTPFLIRLSHSMGYKVKLDTNGTHPLALQDLCKIKECRPDYIAMDIKTSLQKYSLLLEDRQNRDDIIKNITESIDIIESNFLQTEREWRTVLVPPLICEEDIKEIASLLPKDANWRLSSFINKDCLDKKYTLIEPYTDERLKELINLAQSLCANVLA